MRFRGREHRLGRPPGLGAGAKGPGALAGLLAVVGESAVAAASSAAPSRGASDRART